MQSKATTIEAYIAGAADDRKATLRQLDAAVRQTLPTAIASMKYGMPTYTLGDRVVAFNAQKQYFSFYADPAIVAHFQADLAGYSVGKSCIRFRTLNATLMATLQRILESYGA